MAMENRTRPPNPFSISSLLNKKCEKKKQEEKEIDVEGAGSPGNSDNESSKGVLTKERAAIVENKESKQRVWYPEYQPRQTSREASKWLFFVFFLLFFLLFFFMYIVLV